jgi:trigger factor
MSELNVQVEELSPVVKRLQIAVPAARVSQVTESVYRRLGQTVKLRGFRQGHVPRRVLEKYFADRVRSDVAREVMQQTFPEALGTVNLSPVAEPTIEPEEVRPGEEFHYTARVEVRPEVKLGEYKGLEVSVPERVVTDADVQLQLEQLQKRASTLVPIEGREEAQLGDFANVDYDIEIPGAKPEKREGGLLRVTPGLITDGEGEKLVGQKIGETREYTETFSDEAPPDKKGKEARIRLTLTGLKKEELPELDDEFAKDVRNLDTLDALRADIRATMEKHTEEEKKSDLRAAILKKLVELNPLEVPPALVDSAAERMAWDLLRSITSQGMQLPGLEGIVQRVKADAIPRATEEMKGLFLLDAVAKAENIEVAPEEVQAKMEAIAAEQNIPVAKVQAHYRGREAVAGLISSLRNDKAMAVLEAAARVTVQPPTPPASNQTSNESGAPDAG